MSTVHRQPLGRPRDRGNDVAILDAAEQLLGRRGYEAMTIAQVAATAGVSKPTIYLRYGSKRELVAAMIDRLRPPLPATSTGSVTEDLVALIDMQRRWIEQHGQGIVAAVLLEQADLPELMERFKQRVVNPIRDTFRACLRAGVDRGELRPGVDRGEMVDALMGAYWARIWAGGSLTRGWARRLITSILEGWMVPVADTSSEPLVTASRSSGHPRRVLHDEP